MHKIFVFGQMPEASRRRIDNQHVVPECLVEPDFRRITKHPRKNKLPGSLKLPGRYGWVHGGGKESLKTLTLKYVETR